MVVRVVQKTMDHAEQGEDAQSAFSAFSAFEQNTLGDISPDAL
jgi:hypothetical protein